MIMANKIGWCDMTWNPVWGCKNHCEYCYARGIAHFRYKQMIEIEYNYHEKNYPNWEGWTGRFSGLREFKPTWLEAQFNKKFPKKPQRIFVGSMSEIAYWKKEWMKKVIEKTKEYPQHIFQFLTKDPRVYQDWSFPDNCWLGVTIIRNPKEGEPNRWDYYEFKQHNQNNLKFVCFEPLLMDMQLIYFLNLEGINWVIIGAETGNRKGKVVPQPAWIDYIVDYCINADIPIYLKDSLKDIYPVEIKEFPKGGDLIENVKD